MKSGNKIQAYVSDETKQAIAKMAKEQDRSESYVVGNILDKMLAKTTISARPK